MSRCRRPRAVHPPSTYLGFERPLAAVDAEIAALAGRRAQRTTAERLRVLRAARRRLERDLVRRLTPWERVQLARHPDRPSTLDYVRRLCTQFVELHGDRRFADDGAVVGGLARFAGRAVVVVGQQRGRTPAERIARNFGMARPEGYRKAVRLFELAERFRRRCSPSSTRRAPTRESAPRSAARPRRSPRASRHWAASACRWCAR